MDNKYFYYGKVLSVYDGDTITVELNLGFNVKIKEKIRFYGIDCKEIRGSEREEGLIAKNFVKDKIENKDIMIKTIKDKKGKYGRYLGIIYYKDNEEWIDLNKELVDKKLASVYLI